MGQSNSFFAKSISRRDVLKFGGLAGVAAASAGLLAACTTTAGAGAGGAAGGALPPALFIDHLIANVPAFTSTDLAMKRAAVLLKEKHEFVSHDGDMTKATSQEATFPVQNAKGVFFYLVADAAIGQYSHTLTSKKVAVSNLSNRLPWFDPTAAEFSGYNLGNMGGPFADEAYVITKLLLERGGGSGDLIFIGGPKGGLSETARRYGAMKAIAEYPNVKMRANAYTNWDPTVAQTAVKTLIPQYPNAKFVLCLNDGVAQGALAALNALRNTKALVCGMDGDPDFLEQMQKQDRIVATSAGLIAFSGVLGLVRLYDHYQGVKSNPLESFINTDSVIVDTPAAAEALLNITSDSAPLLWDPRKMSRHLSGNNWSVSHNCQIADPEAADWGPTSVNPTAKPAGFKWSPEYTAAAANGGIAKLNKEWASRFKNPYTDVIAKATYKKGALGALKEARLVNWS